MTMNRTRDFAPTLLRQATLLDLVGGLEQRLFTVEQLVRAYSSRTQEVNDEFHAVIEMNPDALRYARFVDLEQSTSRYRGPLHGIPILLKDNLTTLDKTDTTSGSLALIGARPANEAEVVTALRKAGAVILGKANMAEWSGFRSTSGCSGWSARGGQTRGIFYPGMKASGSSGGGAVAVALGLCAAAIGTETCYSIVSPAEKSGIIGFKPTRDLISSRGIISASQRLDTVGLLTRTVPDAVQILLELVYQSSHHTLLSKVKIMQDVSLACLKVDLTGVRIGISSQIQDLKAVHKEKTEAFRRVLDTLESAGATLVHDVTISGAEAYESLPPSNKQVILDTDMKSAINSYLSSLVTNPQNISNLQDLIDFTKSCPAEEYPHRNVDGFERAQATDPDGALYRNMLAKDDHFVGAGGIEGALNRHGCDILIVPALSITLQTFAAKAGSPVVSVPMGSFSEDAQVQNDAKNGLVDIAPGVPFSAYIFGRAAKDEDVLKVGYVLEQMMKVGRSLRPYMEPKTEVVDVQHI